MQRALTRYILSYIPMKTKWMLAISHLGPSDQSFYTSAQPAIGSILAYRPLQPWRELRCVLPRGLSRMEYLLHWGLGEVASLD